MDARTQAASIANQVAAAQWHASSVRWWDAIAMCSNLAGIAACTDFAVRDQDEAARLYRADRQLRGLEG